MADFPTVFTMGEASARAWAVAPGDVCISIRSPGAAAPDLPAFDAVLGLQFADGQWSDPRSRRACITACDADRVVAFVLAHRRAPRLVIHCTAGVSRSVSMAEALRWCFDPPRYPSSDYPILNPNVFCAIVAAWEHAAAPAPEGEG